MYAGIVNCHFRNYKTAKKKKDKSSSEPEAEPKSDENEDREKSGIKLLAQSKKFLDSEEPIEKPIKQTKPDLLAHRKVSTVCP